MKNKLAILLFFVSLLLSFSVVHAEELQIEPKISKFSTETLFAEEKEYDNNELIVKFKSNLPLEKKVKILSTIKGKEIESLNQGGFSLVTIPKAEKLEKAAEKLLTYKEIEYVEPNYKIEQQYIPNDPGYKKQWHLKKIQTPKAWDVTKGSSKITVAVIDSGVQTNHPDLKGKIVSPYNAVTGGKTFTPQFHGTHVAGIIAASINKKGVTGVAPQVKIMPINVFSGDSASAYSIVDAIYYAVDHGANIINMSLGSYYYNYSMDYATAYARSKGVVLIAAAGNDNTYYPTYPAGLDGVLGVSATGKTDRITWFSNYGSHIDLAAPGDTIYSTGNGSTYKYANGTSMASPVVSGVAALILSKNPYLTPGQVESILRNSSKDLGPKGWDDYYGYGRVDANNALKKTPKAQLSVSGTSKLTTNGKNKAKLTISAHKGPKLSVYVQNSKGKVIKKLVNSKTSTGKKVSVSWNGKQDNGYYAGSGTYTIVAKLSTGRETLTKKKTVKITNKIKPTFKLGKSTTFSPVKKKLTTTVDLNKKAVVTAKIYDRKNKLVRTVWNKKTVYAGKTKLTWDGKNNKKKRVADGSYKLVVSGVDTYKIKASSKTMTIKVDTKGPSAKLVNVQSPFKQDGTNKSAVKMTVSETVKMNAFVVTEKGSKVKQLAKNKSYKKGTYTLKWNGKNDKGAFVSEGNYRYQVELVDAIGNKKTTKSKTFSLQNQQKPTVTATTELYYRKAETVSYSYKINKPGKVTIQILNSNKVVRTIESKQSKTKAGTYKFTWDGKDSSGKTLADGKYQYKITLTDKYNRSATKTGTMMVALTKVAIEYPKVVQLYSGDIASEIYYKLSHPATVTVEIYDQLDTKVKTLINNKSQNAGVQFVKWDGSFDSDWDYGYPYTYVIKAANAGGNVTTVKGKITNSEDPEWLISHKYKDLWNNQTYKYDLSLTIQLSKPIKAKLFVFESYNSDILIETKSYQLQKGTNNLSYINDSDDYYFYYILQYVDELGNQYLYEIYDLDYDYSRYEQKNDSKLPKESKVKTPNRMTNKDILQKKRD